MEDNKRVQVWLVEATPNEANTLFMWAFFKKEEARLVYHTGKKARPDLHWTNTPLAFGGAGNALHHIKLLKDDLTTEEELRWER